MELTAIITNTNHQTTQALQQPQGGRKEGNNELIKEVISPIKIRNKAQSVDNRDDQEGKKKVKSVQNDEKDIIDSIERLSRAILKPHTELHFTVHEKTNRINVKIVNTQTQEVIREIQPEKVLDMIAKMWEVTGILVDEKV
ncbi:MAG: hypothetical protein CVV02_07720 [Firmicutes bacterium HGW-Firmicutes-7]|nr:MAG: hypothetical protein CVV02_07720 [Firmicutes bacterium HGW-Firmicutes-7]